MVEKFNNVVVVVKPVQSTNLPVYRPEIHKLASEDEVKDFLVSHLYDNYKCEVESEYMKYVADGVDQSWDFCPEPLSEWLHKNLDKAEFEHRGVYWK